MWVTVVIGPELQLSPEAVSANADLAVFFVVGLLAGAHSLGICGPSSASTPSASRRRRRGRATA